MARFTCIHVNDIACKFIRNTLFMSGKLVHGFMVSHRINLPCIGGQVAIGGRVYLPHGKLAIYNQMP